MKTINRFLYANFFLGLVYCTVHALATESSNGHQVVQSLSRLEAGEYSWHPETSPVGPVVIIASLTDQVLYVYRNGKRIGRSTISSGKPGKSTPTGVFTILQKKVKHTSNIFRGASMPYMERLTWRGVAMHAGTLPGYPASHGCIRLPLDFARKLYSVTLDGTTVIITDHWSRSGSGKLPALLFNPLPDVKATPSLTFWDPSKAPEGPLSIIVSSAEAEIYVYRDGVEIGRSPLHGLEGLTGLYVYSALENVDDSGRREWFSTASMVGTAPDIRDLMKRVRIDQAFLESTRSLITPGTTLVLTDAPVTTQAYRASKLDIFTTIEK
ncbi:MAG: L,D-transpeptidase family protein [bacterium]